MLIPSQTLELGPVPFGKTVRANHGQFGTVELVSDGAVDDSFKARNGYGNGAQCRDFRDPGLLKLIASEKALADASLRQASQRFESGSEPDKYKEDRVNCEAVCAAVKQAGIKASTFPQTDWRGVITHTTIHMEDDQMNRLQSLHLDHKGGQTEARLTTSRYDGVHLISAPVNADGTINLEQSQEHLTLNTPWLGSDALSGVPHNGIKQLGDPRLERLAAAAQQGFHLPPDELGEGWKSSTSGNRQTWTTGSWGKQEVVLDSQARTFELYAESSVSCNGGNNDYDAKSRIRWHDGQMQRVK